MALNGKGRRVAVTGTGVVTCLGDERGHSFGAPLRRAFAASSRSRPSS